MKRVAIAIVLILLPLALADDPDPPEFVDVSDPGPGHAGQNLTFQLTWQDASGIVQMDALVQGPNGLHVWTFCDEPDGSRLATTECTIHLDPRTPGGEYRIVQTWARDAVGHHADHALDVAFSVASPHDDQEPPVLESLEMAVTSIHVAGNLSQWGHLGVEDAGTITAHDAGTVRYASASFAGPGDMGLQLQCYEDGFCELFGDADLPAGDYVLDRVDVEDDIGYHRIYVTHPYGDLGDLRAAVPDLPSIRLITNNTDAEPPVLHHLTFPEKVHRGQPFEIEVRASDDTSVDFFQLWFRTTRGNADYTVFHRDACDTPAAPHRNMTCTGRFPTNFPLGLAIVETVIVEDPAMNMLWASPPIWSGWYQHDWFTDNDDYDVGVVLTPRPLEGVIEAIDAVKNEVVAGEVATIIYQVQDDVDDVALTLEDEAGKTFEIVCQNATLTDLGRACDMVVPEASGVLDLRKATVEVDEAIEETVYSEAVPLLAVAVPIPDAGDLPIARGGGPANNIGIDYQAAREEEAPKEDDVKPAPQERNEDAAIPSEPTKNETQIGDRRHDKGPQEDAGPTDGAGPADTGPTKETDEQAVQDDVANGAPDEGVLERYVPAPLWPLAILFLRRR